MLKEIKRVLTKKESDNFRYIILELTNCDVELNRLKDTLKLKREELAKIDLEISKFKNLKKIFHKNEYEKLLNEREQKQSEVISAQAKINKFLRKTRDFIVSNGIMNEKEFTDDYPISKVILKVTDLYNNYLTFLESAKNIKELNLTLSTAIQMLSKNGFPIVLDDEDKEIIDNPIELMSMEEFVLVQKLNTFPVHNRLATAREKKEKETFSLLKIGSVSYANGHNTVHFTVNGINKEEQGQYAIIIPFCDMPISQLKSSNPNDTYFESGITIPTTAYLLCPERVYNVILKQNPSFTVIGYKGNDINSYIEAIIGMTGRKVEKISTNGWLDRQDNRKFGEINAFTNGTYSGSTEEYDKINYEGISIFSSLIELLIQNNTPVSSEMIAEDIARNIQLLSINKIDETLLGNVINYINSFLRKFGLFLDSTTNSLIRELYLGKSDLAIEEMKKYLTQELNIDCENETLSYLLNLYLINNILNEFINKSLIQKASVYQNNN